MLDDAVSTMQARPNMRIGSKKSEAMNSIGHPKTRIRWKKKYEAAQTEVTFWKVCTALTAGLGLLMSLGLGALR